jgi:hypothetical protein
MKIVSGGQTGVDRAALDAAIENGLSYRGWCPRGGWAEDLPEPPGLLAVYPQLRATPQADPAQRTEWNVRDSSGLMVLVDRHGLAVSKGTERALAYAGRLGKPHIVIELDRDGAVAQAQGWTCVSAARAKARRQGSIPRPAPFSAPSWASSRETYAACATSGRKPAGIQPRAVST